MVAVGVCLLQAVAKHPVSTSLKIIAFPRRMATVQQSEPKLEQNPVRHDPVVHGSKAAIAAAIFAGIAAIAAAGTFYVNLSNRSDQKTQQVKKQFETDVNALIDAKLTPAVRAVNDHKDEKITELGNQLHALDVRIARLEGPLTNRVSSLEHRTDQQASLAQLVLSDLQRNLNATDRSTPGYWPVAAQFISYRSQVNVVDFQTLSRPDMPNCTDRRPTPMEYRMTSEEERSTIDETNRVGLDSSRFIPAIYENCRFVLDSPQEAERFPLLGASFNLEFKNCQIIYNGGPIAILTPNPRFSTFIGRGPTRSDVFIIRGQGLRFENCLFLFTIKAVPPQEGQQMTHELLAQSGPTLSYGHVSIGGE